MKHGTMFNSGGQSCDQYFRYIIHPVDTDFQDAKDKLEGIRSLRKTKKREGDEKYERLHL